MSDGGIYLACGDEGAAAWGGLGWGGLQVVGGAIIGVLPLSFLPFGPEQTVRHCLFHGLYGVAQVPLVVVGWRATRRGGE